MPDDEPAKLDSERLADAMVAHCWEAPGEPYAFYLTAAAVELIVAALREHAALRKPPN